MPVTKEASGETSHSAAAAHSSAVPRRPIGWAALYSVQAAAGSGLASAKRRSMGVSMIPGQSAFTRMPQVA